MTDESISKADRKKGGIRLVFSNIECVFQSISFDEGGRPTLERGILEVDITDYPAGPFLTLRFVPQMLPTKA